MTSIASIFSEVRAGAPQIGEPNVYRYMETFDKLTVGRSKWHGQINIAKDLSGPWVVTIYLLCPRSKRPARDEQAVSFHHHAKTMTEALAEVERLTVEWSQATTAAPQPSEGA